MARKTCSRCGRSRNLGSFYTADRFGHLRGRCKDCECEVHKEWLRDPEVKRKRQEQEKGYRLINKEKIEARRVRYYAKNREKIIAWNARYVRRRAASGYKRVVSKETMRRNQQRFHKDSITFNLWLKTRRGGCCENCGYSKNLAVLSWHHRDQSSKSEDLKSGKIRFTKVARGTIRKLLDEVRKCQLLCPNCHFEIHSMERDRCLDTFNGELSDSIRARLLKWGINYQDIKP